MRQKHTLTDAEQKEFWQLNQKSQTNRAVAGEAWTFWRKVAAARNLDPTTLIGKDWAAELSGLPIGHGKHWCYPSPLQCQHRPVGIV